MEISNGEASRLKKDGYVESPEEGKYVISEKGKTEIS